MIRAWNALKKNLTKCPEKGFRKKKKYLKKMYYYRYDNIKYIENGPENDNF